MIRQKISSIKVAYLFLAVIGVGIGLYFILDDGGLSYKLSFLKVNEDGLTIQEQIENKKQEIAEYTPEKYKPIERGCLDEYYGKGKGDISMLQRWLNGDEPHPNDLPRLKSHKTYYGLGSLQCAGQFGTHMAKTAGILAERSAYENKVTSLNNELKVLEKSIETLDVICKVKSDVIIRDVDGDERIAKSSTITPSLLSVAEVQTQTSSMIDGQTGKEIDRFIVSPKISCSEIPAPITILPSEMTVSIKSQDSDGSKNPTFMGFAPSNTVTLKNEDYYEIVRFELPVKYILQFLSNGDYTSYQEIYVGGVLEFQYKEMIDAIGGYKYMTDHSYPTKLDIPIEKAVGEDLRVIIETKVSKNMDEKVDEVPVVINTPEPETPTAPPVEVESEIFEFFIEDDFLSGVTSPTISYEQTSVENTISPSDAITSFTDNILNGNFAELNDQKYYTIFIMILLFLIIAIFVSVRLRNRVLAK